MWSSMKHDVAKQHIQLRNELRKQFQREQGSDADLLYESKKLFKPIMETSENIKDALASASQAEQAQPKLKAIEQPEPALAIAAPPAYAIIDPDQGLDIETIEEMGFTRPSRMKDYDSYDDVIEKVINYNKHVLGRAKQGSTADERSDINDKIIANRDYVKRL